MEIKKKRGRPPKQKTVERRIEKALRGKPVEEEKRGPGRPRLEFGDRPEHIRFALDCFALGYSPSRIVNLLKERYGELDERVLGVSTLVSYRKKYASEIQQREKELREELPILLPSMRMRYLQRVVDEASEGVPVLDKAGQLVMVDGQVVRRKDHTSVIQAVKEINAMQRDLDEQRQATAHEMSVERETAELKEVIKKHVEEQVILTGMKPLDILKGMSDSFTSEYSEAFDQLVSEYKM